MNGNASFVVFGLALLTAGWVGYGAAPREILDNEVQQVGLGAVDTRDVLSATVESLRSENKLIVFSYRGLASVTASRKRLWVFQGSQLLLAPATVNYLVDFSSLSNNSVRYDADAKLVTITIPPLVMGDVAFHPDEATTFNDGVLTFSQSEVDQLNRSNYAYARRAIIKQAQQPTLLRAAEDQAVRSVEADFAVPLKAVGRADIRVVARFAPRGR